MTLCSSNGNLAEAPEEEHALAAHRQAVISGLMDSRLSRDKVKVDMAEHFLLSLQVSIPPCAISVVTESVAYQAACKLNRPPGPAFSELWAAHETRAVFLASPRPLEVIRDGGLAVQMFVQVLFSFSTSLE